MINVFQETIEQIPSLVVVDGQRQTEPLPVLVYYHGFTSAKEHNLPIAYLLADKGYRVVLPDSLYHGQRTQDLTMSQLQLAFWDIVVENVTDIKTLADWLNDQHLILDGRIGIAGTSMGGITTAGALVQYPWIKAAAIMMGTPRLGDYAESLLDQYQQSSGQTLSDDDISRVYQSLKPIDLSKHIETLNERPLFFWHGDKDPVVPFDHASRFYKEALNHYDHVDRIQFLKEKDRGHKVSRFAMLSAVNWLTRHL